MSENSVKGTIFKLNVTMDPIDGYHLADVDWTAEVYSERGYGKKIIIPKEDARMVDEDNYIIVVDSDEGGVGHYLLTLTVMIPDADCPDGKRIERATAPTGVIIIAG